jgi:hypothetical protein
MSKATGADAYTINLIPENRIGGGQYADVFKVQIKDSKEWCAAKLLKARLDFFDYLDKLAYDRER